MRRSPLFVRQHLSLPLANFCQHTQSRAFFNLPLESKLKAPHPAEAWHHRGYSTVGQEKVSLYPDPITGVMSSSGAAPTFECKESFDIGRDENDSLTPNIWPPDDLVPGFREANVRLFETLRATAMQVLAALALGMGLPDERFFDGFHSVRDCANQLRLLHYPPVERAALQTGEKERIVAHTDKGTITLLLQEDDGVGGLEVEAEVGGGRREFVAAPAVPGAVLINIGDLLQMWSNDVLRSTRHRVGLPPSPPSPTVLGEAEADDGTVGRRFSVAYFIAVDRDAVVDCLEPCHGPDRPKKYPPVLAWDYITKAMSAAY